MRKLTPQQWLDTARLTFRLDPSEPPDPQGRLTEAMSLPPGTYEVDVRFDDSAPRRGDLLASLGAGHPIARTNGPLPSLARLALQAPIAVPQFWVQMSHAESASAARRVEVVPVAVVPRRQRRPMRVSHVEAIAGQPGAYMAYVDGDAFPEGGVFWTRGTTDADVLVAPAGAPAINLTLHAGPVKGDVLLTVNGNRRAIALEPEDTRVVSIPVGAGEQVVRFTIQSLGAFRPVDVDPTSHDTRLLGCQVRVEAGELR
jgi:hypothetical protein